MPKKTIKFPNDKGTKEIITINKKNQIAIAIIISLLIAIFVILVIMLVKGFMTKHKYVLNSSIPKFSTIKTIDDTAKFTVQWPTIANLSDINPKHSKVAVSEPTNKVVFDYTLTSDIPYGLQSYNLARQTEKRFEHECYVCTSEQKMLPIAIRTHVTCNNPESAHIYEFEDPDAYKLEKKNYKYLEHDVYSADIKFDQSKEKAYIHADAELHQLSTAAINRNRRLVHGSNKDLHTNVHKIEQNLNIEFISRDTQFDFQNLVIDDKLKKVVTKMNSSVKEQAKIVFDSPDEDIMHKITFIKLFDDPIETKTGNTVEPEKIYDEKIKENKYSALLRFQDGHVDLVKHRESTKFEPSATGNVKYSQTWKQTFQVINKIANIYNTNNVACTSTDGSTSARQGDTNFNEHFIENLHISLQQMLDVNHVDKSTPSQVVGLEYLVEDKKVVFGFREILSYSNVEEELNKQNIANFKAVYSNSNNWNKLVASVYSMFSYPCLHDTTKGYIGEETMQLKTIVHAKNDTIKIGSNVHAKLIPDYFLNKRNNYTNNKSQFVEELSKDIVILDMVNLINKYSNSNYSIDDANSVNSEFHIKVHDFAKEMIHVHSVTNFNNQQNKLSEKTRKNLCLMYHWPLIQLELHKSNYAEQTIDSPLAVGNFLADDYYTRTTEYLYDLYSHANKKDSNYTVPQKVYEHLQKLSMIQPVASLDNFNNNYYDSGVVQFSLDQWLQQILTVNSLNLTTKSQKQNIERKCKYLLDKKISIIGMPQIPLKSINKYNKKHIITDTEILDSLNAFATCHFNQDSQITPYWFLAIEDKKVAIPIDGLAMVFSSVVEKSNNPGNDLALMLHNMLFETSNIAEKYTYTPMKFYGRTQKNNVQTQKATQAFTSCSKFYRSYQTDYAESIKQQLEPLFPNTEIDIDVTDLENTISFEVPLEQDLTDLQNVKQMAEDAIMEIDSTTDEKYGQRIQNDINKLKRGEAITINNAYNAMAKNIYTTLKEPKISLIKMVKTKEVPQEEQEKADPSIPIAPIEEYFYKIEINSQLNEPTSYNREFSEVMFMNCLHSMDNYTDKKTFEELNKLSFVHKKMDVKRTASMNIAEQYKSHYENRLGEKLPTLELGAFEKIYDIVLQTCAKIN